MVKLRRDLTVIANTIQIAHPSDSVFLSHLTKEMASLLLDQSFSYRSSLVRRFTIHGVETISKDSGILEKPSSLNGSLARLAEQTQCYQISRKGTRTIVRSLLPPMSLDNLVVDEFLYKEEAKLLGRLTITEKTALAGHRNTKMTIESYETVARMTLCHLRAIKEYLSMRDNSKIDWEVHKVCECADELVRKVDFYPAEIRKVKSKLDVRPSIAAAMLASDIQESQGSFDENIMRATVVRRGIHLLRSILAERGISHQRSKSAFIEERRFKETCKNYGLETPKVELCNYPAFLIDFLLALLEQKENLRLAYVEQTA